MKEWILAALLITLSMPGLCASPDFSWDSECSKLSLSREKWHAAADVAPQKGIEPAQAQRFDCSYLRQLLRDKDFPGRAFRLLDDAMRRSRELEEARKLYTHALEQCRPGNAAGLKADFNKACLELKYSISLATALARAGIAQRMATTESSSYCFQAMESAIDTLSAAQKEETDKQRLESLRKLRKRLFDKWEQAQRTKDLDLIRDFDLLRAFDETIPLPLKQAGTQ